MTAVVSATPSPAGTPWPPPDISLEQRVNILDDNDFPIHPNERTVTLSLSWPPQPNFTGSYEVQWVPVTPGAPREYQFLVILDPTAAAAKQFALPVPFNDWLNFRFCFRVRAFTLRPGAGSAADRETGPFSTEVCSILPVVDGPFPPVVGTGSAGLSNRTDGQTSSLVLVGAGAVLAGAMLGIWWLRNRHVRSSEPYR